MSGAKMTREEAIAYCDKHLPRVRHLNPYHEKNWDAHQGWGHNFNEALWFSSYGDYYFGAGKHSESFANLAEGVREHKKYMIARRLIGAKSSND